MEKLIITLLILLILNNFFGGCITQNTVEYPELIVGTWDEDDLNVNATWIFYDNGFMAYISFFRTDKGIITANQTAYYSINDSELIIDWHVSGVDRYGDIEFDGENKLFITWRDNNSISKLNRIE